MTVRAKIIADSISEQGVRLTTLQCRYPRMIHSELMTHRVFSRNGRSSRAVPVATLLKEEPYLPHFMMNQPGMVASEEMDPSALNDANEIWLDLVEYTKEAVANLNALKVHKQWANRPLEWFGYIDVLISSTDWANFFALRDEVGAQPEIDELSKAIKTALDESKPTYIIPGMWHMPYICGEDFDIVANYLGFKEFPSATYMPEYRLNSLEYLKKISVARCARLTIKPFDGDGSIEKELNRYDLLMVSRPVHASPAEHIATPDRWVDDPYLSTPTGYEDAEGDWIDDPNGGPIGAWLNEHQHGNYFGWRQFRKMIPFNTIEDER